MDPRTQTLLEAPVGRTIVRLALPNVAVMVVQTCHRPDRDLFRRQARRRRACRHGAGVPAVHAAGRWCRQAPWAAASCRRLPARLAPTTAAAPTLWSGTRSLSRVVLSAATTGAALLWGPKLYALMGGRDASLAKAVTYSNIIFAAAIPLWLFNSFAAMIRATGNMVLPATVIIGGAFFLIPVSPLLIFGLGPLPQLGIAGGAIAVLIYYVVGGVIFAVYHLVRPRRAQAVDPSAATALGAAQGHPPRRASPRVDQPVDQRHRRRRNRACRPGRSRRGCRLRHRRAARISAGAAGVRPRRAGCRHGRHGDRRRPARTRDARCLDRRGHRRRRYRSDRPCRRVVSACVAVAVRRRRQPCWPMARSICALSARSTASSAPAWRSISPRKAPAALAGR